MFIKKLKTVIKSIPFLYKILLPVVTLFRKRQGLNTGIDSFRQCCFILTKAIPEPFFVKVGANDGITEDPCSDILLENPNWRGLLIEPVPYIFVNLKLNFSDHRRFFFEQVAIGASAEEAIFYYVSKEAVENIPNLPVWYDQLGSFDRNHIVNHLDGALEPFITEYKIQVCPLTEVLKKHRIQNVHLLHVDTEGHDYEVLKTLDFSQYKPLVILIEHKHLSDDQKNYMLHLLKKHRYTVRDCGGDYFAVNEEAKVLLKGKVCT